MQNKTFEKRRLAGLCIVCGLREPDASPLFCGQCAATRSKRARERRAGRGKDGLCTSCGDSYAAPHFKQCQECIDKKRDEYARCERESLCKRCGKPRDGTEKKCRVCRDKERQARAQKVAAGVCPACGGAIDKGSSCANCKQGYHRLYEKRVAESICTKCGARPSAEGGLMCSQCKDAHSNYRQAYIDQGICVKCKTNPAEPDRTACRVCLDIQSDVNRRRKTKLKFDVMAEYGNKCQCCGEGHIEFLTIDHIRQDGAQHREAINAFRRRGEGSIDFYQWLKKNGYPKDNFRCLCYNCNIATYRFGSCPHQRAD